MGVWDTFCIDRMITNRRLVLLFLCVFGATCASGAESDPPIIAIRAGRILPVSGDVIENGVILIEKGRIKTLGTDVVVPRDVHTIDARDKTVIPGLIDTQSRL